jgi:hypothetical protein
MPPIIDMNQIQDSMLYTTFLCRESINRIFLENSAQGCHIDATLKRIFAYFSERSQTVSHLISIGYPWDAEIILRTVYESSAKIWLICLSSHTQRDNLIQEFWETTGYIHNRKRSHKAHLAKQIHMALNTGCDTRIFDLLEYKNLFNHDSLNKKERKSIEQKWSFSEIIQHLEKNHPPDFPMKYISCLLFQYNTASHLIHCDDSALDLMLDRKTRDNKELFILERAHMARMWGDLVSLWFLSFESLRYRYSISTKNDELEKSVYELNKLCDPIQKVFRQSQHEFYNKWEATINNVQQD